MLESSDLVAFVAATDLDRARVFYEQTLGLRVLEADEIPYRKVGTHRRIRFEDLREYRRRDDRKRRQVADELTQLSEELGLS